jgi:hypothetical protein
MFTVAVPSAAGTPQLAEVQATASVQVKRGRIKL